MKQTDIAKAASSLTQSQFSEELSSFLKLTKEEIDQWFPNELDRAELASLVDIVVNAADDNQRKARLIQNIDKLAAVTVKLLQKTAIGI